MNLPGFMRAMVLEKAGQELLLKHLPLPAPAATQLLIKVIACGICRTDLHVIDGELRNPKLPLIPGHEIIGEVILTGTAATKFKTGDIIGVPWLGNTCGVCRYCLRGDENLCDKAEFTGYTIDGGYAEYTVADEKYCFKIPPLYTNASGAPLLCAGLIGFRSYRMLHKPFQNIGLYGFGAAAHILIQVANYYKKRVFAFTKDGDIPAQQFALQCGAVWAGDSSNNAPEKLDAAIIFAPVGSLVPKALENLDKGGIVVCGGIHMSNIPSFAYKLLWEERSIQSVANLKRSDGEEFLKIAPLIPVKTTTRLYSLSEANKALYDLKSGNFEGAAVLVME